jgi:NAD(P)H-flavin reductase
MEATQEISPYVNWQAQNSLFSLVEKDEDDQFKLLVTEKELISHDTLRIVLKFPNDDWISGLWPAGHFKFHHQIDGKTVTKPYTPVSLVSDTGSATFIIKVYRPNEEFPEGGKASYHLEQNVNVGDHITVEGPIGLMRYYGNGRFARIKKELSNLKTKVGLIAGGTGITPILSVIQAAVLSGDNIELNILYTNKTKNDILCQDIIDKYVSDKCKISYTLTRHNDETDGEWDGLKGRVSAQMLQDLGFPAPADDVFIYSCGPSEMN